MRVAHLNVHERHGGAGRAAHRLHARLRLKGVDSHLVVHRGAEGQSVHPPGSALSRILSGLCRRADRWPLRLYPDRDPVPFSPGWMPGVAARRVRDLAPDLLHLHWLGGGFVRLPTLARMDVPVIWTLHDMWPFTGGCHYSEGCGRFRESCGACPRLGSGTERDLSRWAWDHKRRALSGMDLTVVSPSRWLARSARESSLLGDRRIEVIPNGLDLGTYRPRPAAECREALGLPDDRVLVTFGAADADVDPRKGIGPLHRALTRLAGDDRGGRVEVVIFGGRRPEEGCDLPLPVHRLGWLEGEDLVRAYCAADVFVAPSLEDNFPNTVLEALACGTPVVAFDVGGIPELVEPGVHGRLVPRGDASALAEALGELASSEREREAMSRAVREKAEAEYSVDRQADRYRRIYREAGV